MTQAKKMFVVKASTIKLGATRAHNLYSSMKGGAQYVHGTSDDFKNRIRDVNAFIGESDAQMLINKMENRKKYDMVFVPFTGIDNHKKCVTVGSRLLLKEDTEAYTWLLRSFLTTHEKQPTMIVTDQDGAIKLAVEVVVTESKHILSMDMQRYRQEVLDFRPFDSAPKVHTLLKIEIHASKVYTRTIFLLVQKEIIEAAWACQILECKIKEGCEIVKVRDKRASAYRTLSTEKEKEVVQQKEYVAEYKKTCDVIEDIYAVEKPQQNDDNNPQRARNKGGRRGEHTKSGREITLKAKTRQIRKCLCCVKKTNKHTNSCPSNLKYVAKLARLVAAAAEQGTTTAAATKQGATTVAATEEATTTVIVFEKATNAS
nr:hypothetical protein [Tanacetum cinerariifolium]